MTAELLPEVKEEEVAAEVAIPDPAAPTEAVPTTEPEPAASASLDEVTTKFLQERGYELPTEGEPVQTSAQPEGEKLLTRAEAEALAADIASAKLTEQANQSRSQSTVVDFRNRANQIALVLQGVEAGTYRLSEIIPNSASADNPGGVTYGQYVSNQFNQHHAQSGNVAVNGFVQNLWADLAQDIPEADRKDWLNRRTQDKTLADLRADYKSAVTKGMITTAEAKKLAAAQASKDLLEYKALIAPLLPGYVPPVAGGNTPAGGSTELSLEDALNLPIDKLVAYQARQAAR
jgi:hypothetical protein